MNDKTKLNKLLDKYYSENSKYWVERFRASAIINEFWEYLKTKEESK